QTKKKRMARMVEQTTPDNAVSFWMLKRATPGGCALGLDKKFRFETTDEVIIKLGEQHKNKDHFAEIVHDPGVEIVYGKVYHGDNTFTAMKIGEFTFFMDEGTVVRCYVDRKLIDNPPG